MYEKQNLVRLLGKKFILFFIFLPYTISTVASVSYNNLCCVLYCSTAWASINPAV